MNNWQNYKCMFFYLDKFFSKYRDEYPNELDDLGGLLGSMDPYLFADGVPADQTLLENWFNLVGDKQTDISIPQSFDNMINFIRFQQRNFNIDVRFVLNSLQKAKVNMSNDIIWKEWLDCCAQILKNN